MLDKEIMIQYAIIVNNQVQHFSSNWIKKGELKDGIHNLRFGHKLRKKVSFM